MLDAGNERAMSRTAVRDRLKRAALSGTDVLVAMTQALVRCDSQTPPSDTREAAEVAASFLTGCEGVEMTFHPSDPPVINLVARLSGGLPGPRLVLSGHLDTYPIGDPAGWTVDPLGGLVVQDRLYGRGSSDMKGGIATQILVMQLFAELARPFPGELVLALAGDEESMGELGTQRLIDTVPEVIGDAVMVADVGSPQIIRCGEKGMIWLDVEARGKAAHGAHVHRGENAIERLMAALQGLGAIEALPIDLPDEVARTMAAAKPVSEPLGGAGEQGIMSRVTMNIGRIEGGLSANLVPEIAQASIDIRLPMGTTVATVESEIRKLLGAVPDVSWTVTRRYEPSWTSPEHPLSKACAEAAREVIEQPVAINMRVGASDARLWRRAGVPTVVCGLTPNNLGGADEFLVVSELANLAALQAVAIWDFMHAAEETPLKSAELA